MAARPSVAAQELAVEGVQGAASPINLETILSASTMKEWWSLLRASVGSELSQLHWDILDFCKAYELTPRQIHLRNDALAYIECAVRKIWPTFGTFLFGSTATGLALPWSDIDVVIMPPKYPGPFSQNPTPKSWQNALARKLNALGQCHSLETIRFARVPILKVVFNSGIACDVSFDSRNSHASVSLTRHFVDQYEAFRPLCLVLKFFLGQKNLNGLHIGGLGSFCMITMVISCLQKTASIVEAGSGDLGTLLLFFFAYYSNIHNYTTDVVSTRPEFCGSKQDKGWVSKKNPQLLAVEDPLDPTSNIGKGSYRIEQVRNKFSVAQRALLTHWHDEHVLDHIVDTTLNPNQRLVGPSPEKSKRSKKRRIASGQEAYVLTHQPASKIPWRHRPQQATGLVTRSQLDRRKANIRCPHFTSGLPPISSRLKAGHDEGKLRSVQNVFAQIPPAQLGVPLLRTTQGNARGCSRAQEDSSKGSYSVYPNDFPQRKTPRIIPNHQFTANDCRPIQSVHTHLRRDGMDALGLRENQAETINIEFWESQLSTRSKQRAFSLKQGENPTLYPPLSRTPDSSRGPRGSKHLTMEEDRPMQSGHSHLTQEGLNAPVTRGNQAERMLVEFWESHIATPSKPRKTFPRLSAAGINDSPAGAEQSVHHELLQRGSTIQLTAQDEMLLQIRGAGGNNKEAQAERAQFGNQLPSKTQNVKSVEKCTTENNTKHDLVVQIVHPERSVNGSKIQPSTQDEILVVSLDFWETQLTTKQKPTPVFLPTHNSSRGLGKEFQPALSIHSEQRAQGEDVVGEFRDKGIAVEILEPQLITERTSRPDSLQPHDFGDKSDRPVLRIHDEQPPQGRDLAQKVQEEGISVDFRESRLALRPISQTGALGDAQSLTSARSFSMDDGNGREPGAVLPRQLNHGDRPESYRDVSVGNGEDEIVEFWEAQLTTRLKAGNCSSEQRAAGCEYKNALLNRKNRPQQHPPRSSEELDISPDERKLVDFWETHLNPKPKSKNGLLNDQQETGGGEWVLEMNLEERKLVDFWETHLNRKPKFKNGLLNDQQETGGGEGLLEVNPEETKLVDFWETHLNRKPKSKEGPLNHQQAAGGGDEVENAENSKDHGYDRILVDFWEANLTPSLKSRKCVSTHDGKVSDEDIPPGQKIHRDLPREGSALVGRSDDEAVLSTFWEACLNPAFSRQCYLRRKVHCGRLMGLAEDQG